MGEKYIGKTFYDALGKISGKIEIREDGWADFPVPAGNVSVWIPE
ncbi:alpha-amylase domain-containing protein [Chryseobacterium indoltheticum]